jgi:VWFA-related protein
MRSSSGLLLLLLALPVSAAGQTPTVPHAAESVEVSIVNVDAVVVDKHGHRVRGLRRDDFEIFENGVRQPITNFAEYASASAQQSAVAGVQAPPAAPQQPPPPQQRSIIVFVERFRLPSFRSDPLFGALKKLLHDSVRRGDRVMVVSWNRGVVGMRQNFTDDLAKVDTALDALAARTKNVTLNPIEDLRQELDAIAAFESEGAGFQKYGFSGSNPLAASNLPFFAEQAARMSAKVELADERQKVDTLKALMRSAAAVEGKKVLLLATHRLSMYAGAETLFVGGTDIVPAEFRNEFDARPMIRSLVETANANGFTIYPVYAEGLDSASMPSADMRRPLSNGFDYLVLNNETPMLEYVAKETGGVAAWGSTDVTNLLPRIGDDIESYYSLAYRATPGKATSRKVEVRTRDPKLSVRSRRQFVPKNEVVRMEDRVIGALFGNVPESAFQFLVTSEAPKRDIGQSYLIPVTVEVPISALTPLRAEGDVYNGAFSVYMAWGSIIGGVSATHHDTQTFSIKAADLERAKKGHFTYTISVASLTPSLHVAFGVYDEVSREYALRLVDLEPAAPQ